ncbi:cytoplasmic polyadenylated homeobox-like [Fukomys damarensis]|uniref:cytoplasmic polyadenylated homeobox-like n=1 Tax=Fukomys damarensis TaxID=885580 RepID=UPI00053F879F|nr:cytoplasmic polyadenylated homeobox-like [Fukomys damarensis]
MASKGSSGKKDDHNETQERKCGRRKTRPPHRFTEQQLQTLEQSFQQNPYPTFTTKEEFADQFHCNLHVIQKWFKGRRCRLSPTEKKRIFAIWKLNRFHVERSQSLVSPNIKAQDNYPTMSPTSLHDQETLPQRAGDSSLETQTIPRGYFGSGDSVVTGVNREPRCPLEYQGAPASGPSPPSTPDSFIYPNASMQYFENAKYEVGQSQNSLTFLSHYVFNGLGKSQQQEEYKVPYQYLIFQGQLPNHWGYHLQQIQPPQYYQENYQLAFHNQFLPYQNPSDLGQQEPNLPSEQESSGGALSSLLQQAPVQTADRSLQPLGEGKQQVHAEHPRFEIQQLQNGVFPDVHCWALFQ